MIWLTTTPYDPRLTCDPTKQIEGFKFMYMYEFYVQAFYCAWVIAFLVKMNFWPLWPQMTPSEFLDP